MPKDKKQAPKKITLRNVPDDILERINETKAAILLRNKQRIGVSHEEAIYKLIRSGCND